MSIQSLKGMPDILPDEASLWVEVEKKLRHLSNQFGFEEIRTPILEETALFSRSVGNQSDIVQKEMFAFEDQGGTHMCLRPEGTAPIMRSILQHHLGQQKPLQKLFYLGPMFRHERPQKGRLRQFHQMGVEAIGQRSASIDVEVIVFLMTLCELFELPNPTLELNSLGDPDSRKAYRSVIQNFFRDHSSLLSENEQVRLEENPMRLLDSKNSKLAPFLSQAPRILDHLNDASKTYFDEVLAGLDACNIAYTINAAIVRGLDYYGDTAFEVKVDGLGAQSTVGAGGRYDHLADQLQGKDQPGVGFALGIERLMLSMPETQKKIPQRETFSFVPLDTQCMQACQVMAQKLRAACPEATVHVLHGVSSLKSGLRQANKYKTTHALIMGPDERKSSSIAWKNFTNQTQETYSWDAFFKKVSS